MLAKLVDGALWFFRHIRPFAKLPATDQESLPISSAGEPLDTGTLRLRLSLTIHRTH